MTQPSHPLARLLEWLPESDFAVVDHGLAPHGRDYQLTIEHRDDVWPESWSDVFTNYEAWEKADEPEGYVWSVNWPLAYSGLKAIEPSPAAADWSRRLSHPMHEVELATNQFRLRLVYHDIRTQRIDDHTDLISRVIIPLK